MNVRIHHYQGKTYVYMGGTVEATASFDGTLDRAEIYTVALQMAERWEAKAQQFISSGYESGYQTSIRARDRYVDVAAAVDG
jgi:hypothetical protein